MRLSSDDFEQINGLIAPLLKQEAWGVSLGHGSFITIEFGAVLPEVPGTRAHGEWHLWVCHCAWRLEREEEPIVGFYDEREDIEPAIRCLEGQVIQSFKVFSPAGDAVLRFGDDIVLRLFSGGFLGDLEQWMLYMPGGMVLTIGEESGWSFENGGVG